MITKTTLISAFAAFACALQSNAATIVWGALDFSKGVGFGDSSGADLASGSQVILGVFRMTDSEVQAKSADLNSANTALALSALSDLRANFVPFFTGAIGDGVGGLPGLMSRQDTRDSRTVGTPTIDATSKQIYLWASNSTTDALNAGQIGIFTIDRNTNTNWQIPGEIPVSGSTTIDLSNMTNSNNSALAAGASVIYGNGILGTNATLGGPNLALKPAPVPEPSMFALAALGGVMVALRRRR